QLLAFPLYLLYARIEKVRVIRPKPEVVQLVPRDAPRVPSPNLSALKMGQLHQLAGKRLHFTRKSVIAKANVPIGDSELPLGERAGKATAGMMASFRFSLNYGFDAGPVYRFAVQKQGEIPRVEPHEVPYEQYVTVEVTIDVDGKVAEAKVLTGIIPPDVEQKLISAIREFRYDPAKRDGIAIPSLLDIVIHVPS